MSTGHLVGYVGGLAVALGVGAAALTLGTPTASADTGSASSHSATSGTGKSARAPQRQNAVASVKLKPTRKAIVPTASATLLMAAAGAPETRRTLDKVATPAAATGTPGIPIDSTHELATTEFFTTSGGYSTKVALVDSSTGTQIGDTVTLASRLSQEPLVTSDGKHVLIASGVDYNNPKNISQVAVLDIATGTQIGTTVTFTGLLGNLHLVGTAGRTVAPVFLYDYATGTSTTQFAVIDAATGTTVGSGPTLDGSPWDTQMLSVDGTHALVMTSVLDQGNQPRATKLAVLDTSDGTQAGSTLELNGGLTGDPLISEDRIHVLVSTNDDRYHVRTDSHTQILVVGATTGAQAGDTLILDGHVSLGPVVNADGIHTLFVAGAVGSTRIVVVDNSTGEQTGAATLAGATGYSHVETDRAHVLVTATDGAFIRTAVVDTKTGNQTSGATIALPGAVGYTFTDAEDAHVLFTTTDGSSTHIAVIDTATGQQTGATVTLAGTLSRTVANSGDGHVLIATTDGDSSHIAVIDCPTGKQTGATVTAAGELFSWEQPVVTAGGTRVLMMLHQPVDSVDNWIHVVAIDTVTGTQTGTTITLPGWSTGLLSSADGSRAVVVSTIPASARHGSSTRIAVIDTATGNQVGTTIRLTGRPGTPAAMSADGYHLVIRTAAGVRADVDTTTGQAIVTATAPWGFDVEAFSLTPLGQFVGALAALPSVIGVGIVLTLFASLLALGSIF